MPVINCKRKNCIEYKKKKKKSENGPIDKERESLHTYVDLSAPWQDKQKRYNNVWANGYRAQRRLPVACRGAQITSLAKTHISTHALKYRCMHVCMHVHKFVHTCMQILLKSNFNNKIWLIKRDSSDSRWLKWIYNTYMRTYLLVNKVVCVCFVSTPVPKLVLDSCLANSWLADWLTGWQTSPSVSSYMWVVIWVEWLVVVKYICTYSHKCVCARKF